MQSTDIPADVHSNLDAAPAPLKRRKPELNFWQIWNMCFGFMGIQFGFALQNANVSRVFQTLGADYNNMALLWVAAPITGLIVQPIIGYLSDNTWSRMGRRRPFFPLWRHRRQPGLVCYA